MTITAHIKHMTRRRLRHGAKLIALLLLILTALACTNRRDELVFVISLHELVSSGENYDSQLFYPVAPAGEDRIYLVRRFPILDSRFFYRGELLPDPDGVHAGLRLYIDRLGRRIWEQITGHHGGDAIAVVMDGFYVGSTPLPLRMDTQGVCTIKALWSIAEAEKILEHVEPNYRILSSDPGSLH
jgi:hypothetical protein